MSEDEKTPKVETREVEVTDVGALAESIPAEQRLFPGGAGEFIVNDPQARQQLEKGIEMALKQVAAEKAQETPTPPEPFPEVPLTMDPTGELKKELAPEELLAQIGIAKKNRWLAIFIQLCRSKRFLTFVDTNFEIVDAIDNVSKVIETMVNEKPKAVGPPMSAPQVAKIFALLKMYGTRHPEKVLKDIMTTLGQPESASAPPLIMSASDKDVKEAVSDADLKVKLD